MLKTSNKVSIAAATVTLAFAGGVQAQSSTMPAPRTGNSMYAPGSAYIGFNIGQSNLKLNNGNNLFGIERTKNIYSLYAGSYFNEFLGLEIGYADFGRFNRAGGQTKADAFNLGLIGKLPLGTSFNLLGRLGTTYGRTEVSSNIASGVVAGKETGWGGSYGVGAEFVFNPQLSAVLQYDEYNLKFAGGNRDRINTTSLGLRYRF